MPEDWLEPPVVYDLIDEDNMPQETIDGYRGYLLPKKLQAPNANWADKPEQIVHTKKKELKSLQVSIMSPEDIIAMSAVEVFEDEIFTQKRGDETPLEHGPMDLYGLH